MNEPCHCVQEFEGMGRGIMAIRDIKCGEVVMCCEVLPLTTEDTAKILQTELALYTYVYDLEAKRDCVVLGDAELYNHSDDSNISYGLIDKDGRKMMNFKAKRDIAKGEQLFLNYYDDYPMLDLDHYMTR